MRVLGESWHSFIFFGGRARTVRIFMAKEMNAIELAPETYFESLNTKIEKLVGLEIAMIEMFNHNIDEHALHVVRDEKWKTKDQIEAMTVEVKERLIALKEKIDELQSM
jgi:hypothetical protein